MMILGADRLTQFIVTLEGGAHVFGTSDCITRLDDWCRVVTGKGFMGELRGSYSDALGAARLVKRLGGLMRALDDRLGAIGIGRVRTTPQRGDLALVRQDVKNDPFDGYLGAIVLAPGETSVVIAPGFGGVAIVRQAVMPLAVAWRL